MTSASFPPFKPCPCGTGRSFSACCGPYLSGERNAPTAEALMRSRYTGYALRDEGYVLRTWHPSTRPGALRLHEDEVRWLALKIREAHGGTGDARGVVEFEARYASGAGRGKMRERSRFVHEDGRWWYVDGEVPEQ